MKAVVSYGLIGEKIGMTRIFTPDGLSVPVTVLQCGPCYVVQKKDIDRDGYRALQLGYKEVKERKLNKPLLGHLKKAQVPPLRFLAEFHFKDHEKYEVGQVLKVDGFSVGDRVDVRGISKGKGFQGVIRRFGYSGGPKSHGSMFYREPGSIGATDPEKVFKGKGLPGRMGRDTVTVRNLEVVAVYPERNLLLVRGAVPGPAGGRVLVFKRAS
ncbi:MAG: 50S ribosomal protein L3 [Atribacterota bacterium]